MMQKAKYTENPVELTDTIRERLVLLFGDHLKVSLGFSITREKGYYGICYAMPSKNVRSALSVDREVLLLISTFEDQQARTIQTAKDIISESEGRLDSSTFIVIHRDRRGNSKLKKWGREQGLAVLPIFFDGDLPSGDALLKTLSHELYSYDVFDITGPVADDLHFYGRREEARDLAKRLQSGQIRSCFGIRKIGKTSILHRVMKEVDENYSCTTIFVDGQRDAIFELTAAEVLHSLATSLTVDTRPEDNSLLAIRGDATVAHASESLAAAIRAHPQHVLIVFDEIDYLTPTSPTALHWRAEFNILWRNLRAIYQSISSGRKNLSLLISGVSSKWFSEESIGGIENAALSFVPEEYLSPLPRGAAGAMIRKLGRTSGLIFNDEIAGLIASTCADMPFWIRKACSYIHSKIDVGLRPFEPQRALIADYLREFVGSDGTAMSEVALAHLFRVYPEIKPAAFRCAEGRSNEVAPRMLRTLRRYGLVSLDSTPAVSGEMMSTGLKHLEEDQQSEMATLPVGPISDHRSDYGDWADELAIISRRRNLLERRLRGIVANFLRYSAMTDKSQASPKDRILKCVDARRKGDLQRYDLDELMNKLFWLELIAVVKKEWPLFEKIFGDKGSLDRYTELVNDRPDAHAKDLDLFDAAVHRKAVAWFEERLAKIS